MREVGQRAPTLLGGDIVAAIFAFMPILLAAADWLDSPILPTVAAFLSVLCLIASVSILNRSGAHYAPLGGRTGKRAAHSSGSAHHRRC